MYHLSWGTKINQAISHEINHILYSHESVVDNSGLGWYSYTKISFLKQENITSSRILMAFVSAWKQHHLHSKDYIVGWELFGRCAGRGKVISIAAPLSSGEWELFDFECDPGKTRECSKQEPELIWKAVDCWNEYMARDGCTWKPSKIHWIAFGL